MKVFTYPTIREMAERIDDAILALLDSPQLEAALKDIQDMSDEEAETRLNVAIGGFVESQM